MALRHVLSSVVIDALGGFRGTLGKQKLSKAHVIEQHAWPEPAFEPKRIVDLIPDERRAEYTRLGSEA